MAAETTLKRMELEPARISADEPLPYTVWLDGEGYSVEDRKGNRVGYFGLDTSGEGDYQEWNRRASRCAFFLVDALNARVLASEWSSASPAPAP